jgi:large subunit ribosomal protein L21
MYWLVELNNKQYKIEAGEPILVDKLDAKQDAEISIDKVLMVRGDKDEVKIGTPYVKDVKLKARVLGTVSGKKMKVFKYKRRKDYRRTIGSRPCYTKIVVQS